MLTQLESQLSADSVLATCLRCLDEYFLYAAWDNNQVVYRDKECLCAVDPVAEREAIALHHNPPPVYWAPALDEADARADYDDAFDIGVAA